jgi:hypothetical protein
VDCTEFQTNLDRYLDGELSIADMRSAAKHASVCTSCDSLVTSSQQLSALLRTAVTDRVAAVDVSGLWESIEAELDKDSGPVARPLRPRKRPSVGRRFGEWLGALAGDGAFSPVRIGAFAATAAAVALVVNFQTTDVETSRVGSTPDSSVRMSSSSSSSASSVVTASAARERVRPVRIDSMEVAEGHNVTTWMRPKTKTRVIWIGDSNGAEGIGVNNLSLDR